MEKEERVQTADDEEKYIPSFQLISISGDARSYGMEAIRRAQEGKLDEAEELLKKGEEQLNTAHDQQTKMLVEETRGNKNEVNIISVHAQDHLSMAIVVLQLATYIIDLYKELQAVKKPLPGNTPEN